MNIIDISSDLLRAEVYPGDPEPRVHAIQRLDNDDEFDVTALYACLHSGTHVERCTRACTPARMSTRRRTSSARRRTRTFTRR